jgi:hypothetical protein
MVRPSTEPHGSPTVDPGTVPGSRVGIVVVVVVVVGAELAVVVGMDVEVVARVVLVEAVSEVPAPSHEEHAARSTVVANPSTIVRRIRVSVRRRRAGTTELRGLAT